MARPQAQRILDLAMSAGEEPEARDSHEGAHTMTTNSLHEYSEGLADAVERAGASIVTISARRRYPATGIAWSDGLIVTSDHVIEDEEHIGVGLPNGEETRGELVGRDPGADLALIRVSATLTPAEAAHEGSARVGNLVLAVGRPGANPQASLGVIAAVSDRTLVRIGTQLQGTIRSDTTFYPGFSGGPLIDTAGRVLGMNTSRFRVGNVTVSAATIATVAAQLQAHGRIRRAYIGIGSQAVRVTGAGDQEVGLLIVSVETDSPAAHAGLVVGDVLLGIEGTPTTRAEELQAALGAERVGATVKLQLLRGGAPHEVSATLGERPQ